MAVMINESEWQKLKAEREELEAKLKTIAVLAPPCWGKDADPVAFVKSLTVSNSWTKIPGHSDECDCRS